ncbi:MAG: biotin transporter BioY [Clostridiales bacterium]|jgi:biotin transport system substrate-specific component|nr:biotin transporter BioY [Clostridiales bacterium]
MKTKYLALTALFAALTATGAYIKIPTPLAPITLQVFFALASGMLLGKRYGPVSQLLYALLGLIGLPFFSGGGGVGYILTPSFGFIAGFIGMSWLTGCLSEGERGFLRLFGACLSGTFLMYAVAIPYMYFILNIHLGRELSLGYILKTGMLIFLPGDILKCFACAVIGSRLPMSIRVSAKKAEKEF